MHTRRFANWLAGAGLAMVALVAHSQDATNTVPAPAPPPPRATSADLATAPDSPLNALGWLAGCWIGRSGRNEFREHWMRPAGGLMMGMGRTTSGGKAVAYEAMRIELDGAGVPVFTAKPSGKPEASFTSMQYDATGIVFENPAHDFPQRIKYQLKPDGSLDARIEGNLKGREARIEFPMKRTSCE